MADEAAALEVPALHRLHLLQRPLGEHVAKGEVHVGPDPDHAPSRCVEVGDVTVDGGEWRGITNRATPIDVGDELRVVGIDGMVLEVEPLEGGAVDYREQRRARGASARDD